MRFSLCFSVKQITITHIKLIQIFYFKIIKVIIKVPKWGLRVLRILRHEEVMDYPWLRVRRTVAD